MVKVHEQIATYLGALNVHHLYGLVGDANLFMVQSYVSRNLGRYIACTHEAHAVLAAIGYAQATGDIGVATVTHGPALTNCVTAMTEAAKGGIPLVIIAGDTAPGDLQHLQKTGQEAVIAASGALRVDLRAPETLAEDLERAFRLAAHRRLPVVFHMRVDLQWSEIAEPAEIVAPKPFHLSSAPEADIEEVAGLLASARRPLILAGRGALGAKAEIIALAEAIEAPLATTLKAQGLFDGHPSNLGICGGLSHPTAIQTIMNSDVILAFGASLSKHTTEEGDYLKGKRVIQILPDAEENSRMPRIATRVIGDLPATATAIREMLAEAEIPGSKAVDDALRQALEDEAAAISTPRPLARTAEGTVDMGPALHRLHLALPASYALVADLGRFVTTAWRNMPVKAPRDLVYTCHFGGIGCSLGQALGVATADLDRPTVLVAGDGGFLLSGFSELASLARENADFVAIICNDGSYGAEHVQLTNRKMPVDLSMIAPPEFAAIAAAFGFETHLVTDETSLGAACAAVKTRSRPLLIELRVDPDKIDM